jgi:hypothetical protein
VKLSALDSGRPVAIKFFADWYIKDQPEQAKVTFLEEAQSLQLLSHLGLAPKFHGLARDPSGKLGMVMDLVPGDSTFKSTFNKRTLKDLEGIFKRLKEHNLGIWSDFQFNVNSDGRIGLFDLATSIRSMQNTTTTLKQRADITSTYLMYVNPQVAREYFNETLRIDPQFAKAIEASLIKTKSFYEKNKGIHPNIRPNMEAFFDH